MSSKRKLAVFACLLAAAAAVGYAAFYYTSLARKKDSYERLQQRVVSASAAAPAASPAETEAPAADIPIDFAQLRRENPDAYAWIVIPDTQVNYPILQSATDNRYYLDHTIDGASGYPGSIYSENTDAQDFSDFNTILYGHNMKDGSMFGGLKQYRDPEYLQAHRDITVYTPTEKRVYRIFAAVVYSDAYIPAAYDEATEEGRSTFLESLKNTHSISSQYFDDVPVDSSSRILTLSTCIGGQPNHRYLIEAVYVEDAG